MNYTDIQNIFKGLEVQNIVPTPEQLKEALANRHKQPEADRDKRKSKAARKQRD